MDDTKLEKLLETLAIAVNRVEQQGIERGKEMGAFKADVQSDMAALKSDLQGEMATMKSDLQGDIAKLRTDVQADFATLKNDVDVLKVTYGELRFEVSKLNFNYSALQTQMAEMNARSNKFQEMMFSAVDRAIKGYQEFLTERASIDQTLRRHDDEIQLLRSTDEKMQSEIAQLRASS
jgi:predicted  nucleic acid-binding Zn-ribbon protein